MDMLSGFLSSIKPQRDGDMVDRLSYFYSTIILTVFAIFISGWSFVGTPIQCWFPAYYKGWWVEYALDYCYVQNTYFLPFTETPAKNYWELSRDLVHIPKNITERDNRLIGYYQWVPFILALEAILFYIPVVLWRGLYEASGIKVKAICDTASNTENMCPETRYKNIQTIAGYMDQSVTLSESLHGGKHSFMVGRYINTLFLFTKLLFALNCVCQFLMLQHFLGLQHFWWGADIISDLIAGREWIESSNFPRVTLCDFEVRVLGNLHRHTVQCVLMINMFNEKIFVFLWWWLIGIAILSVASFLYWVFSSLIESTGQRIITNYLARIDETTAKSTKRRALVRQFMQDCLKPDGIFLLRLIAANAGDLVCSELLGALWLRYKQRHKQKNGTPTTPRREPSAPPVKLAGGKPEYPTLPIAGFPSPPRYEESLDDADATRQRKPSPMLRESNL